jgi:hypothetical protein
LLICVRMIIVLCAAATLPMMNAIDNDNPKRRWNPPRQSLSSGK